MNSSKIIAYVVALLLFTTVCVADLNAQSNLAGRLFCVDDVGDSIDSNVGDGVCLDSNGKCTLRAAVQESNSSGGLNVINFALPPGSVVELTLGELLITKGVHIVGPGARRLTIQRRAAIGVPLFRVFHVAANAGQFMIIRGFTVRNGNVNEDGGAFYIESGNLIRMTDVFASNNNARKGGAIANAGTLNISRSLFTLNTALTTVSSNGAGGAVMNLDSTSTLTISNTTMTGNSAIIGGALFNAGSLTLINNTIHLNSASQFARNIFINGSGTVNVLNTIISSDNSSAITSLWGAFTSVGNNLITDGRNSTGFTDGVNGDQVSNDNSINPLLGELSDNGGQTNTLELLKGSPAINMGNNCVTTADCPAPVPQGTRLTSDQRGRSRRAFSTGAVDIGAFEVQTGIVIGGEIGFGTVGNRRRLFGSIAVATFASNNEKLYSFINPSGNFFFTNIPLGETIILEIKSKRAGLSSVGVLEFDDLPFFATSHSDFEIYDMNKTSTKSR
jgi:hypothetical protein